MSRPARRGSLYILLGALLLGTLWRGSYFATQKWVFAALLLAAGVWEVAVLLKTGSLRLHRSPALWFLLTYIALAAVNIPRSVSPADTVRETLLMLGLAGAMFTVQSHLARDRDGTLAAVSLWLVYVASFVSAWGVATYFLKVAPYAFPVDGLYRAGSTFEYSNALSCFGLMALPVTAALHAGASSRDRPLLAAAAALQAAAVVLSFSRFGLVALALIAVYIVVSGRRWGAAAAGAAGALAVVFMVMLSQGGRSVLRQRFGEGFSFSRLLPHRLETFSGAADAFRARPVTGSGLGTFAQVYQEYAVAHYTRFAHNLVLQSAVETGLIGAALMAVFMGYVAGLSFLSILKKPDPLARAFAVSCLVFLAYNMFDWEWYVPALAAWFVVGVTCLESAGRREAARPAGPPSP